MICVTDAIIGDVYLRNKYVTVVENMVAIIHGFSNVVGTAAGME